MTAEATPPATALIVIRLQRAFEGRKRSGVKGSGERAQRIDDVRNELVTGASEAVLANAITEAYGVNKSTARQYLEDARRALANELVRYATVDELREMLAHRIARLDYITAEAQKAGDLKVAATCQVHMYRVTEAALRQKMGEGAHDAEQITDERVLAAAVEAIRQQARKLSAEQRQVLRAALGTGHLVAV